MEKPKHHQKIQRTFEFVHANEKSNVKHVESLGKSKCCSWECYKNIVFKVNGHNNKKWTIESQIYELILIEYCKNILMHKNNLEIFSHE